MKYVLFFSVLFTFFLSCNSDVNPCDDYIMSFGFSLVDKDYPNVDLVLEKHLYNPDSIRIEVSGINVMKGYSEGFYTVFKFDTNKDLSIYNDSLYYLYLDSTDIDTLQIKATLISNPCTGKNQSLINEIVYNGRDTMRNEYYYKLLK